MFYLAKIPGRAFKIFIGQPNALGVPYNQNHQKVVIMLAERLYVSRVMHKLPMFLFSLLKDGLSLENLHVGTVH